MYCFWPGLRRGLTKKGEVINMSDVTAILAIIGSVLSLIVTFVSIIVAIVKAITKLNATLTELNITVSNLNSGVDEMKASNKQAHKEFHDEINGIKSEVAKIQSTVEIHHGSQGLH